MSKTLLKVKTFLKLLLTTSRDQTRALLDTITEDQVSAISEIAFNLLEIVLPSKSRDVVRKRRKLLSKLGNKALTLKYKRTLIRYHYRQLIDTLISVKRELLDLLK